MPSIEERLKRVEEQMSSRPVESPEKGEQKAHQVTALTAIVAALAGVLAGAVPAYLQGRSGISLEESKFRYSLIQAALAQGDEKAAAEKLAFLVKLGLLEDKKGTITKLVANPSNIPVATLEERLAEQSSQLSVLNKYAACIEKNTTSDRLFIFDFATLECLEAPSKGIRK